MAPAPPAECGSDGKRPCHDRRTLLPAFQIIRECRYGGITPRRIAAQRGEADGRQIPVHPWGWRGWIRRVRSGHLAQDFQRAVTLKWWPPGQCVKQDGTAVQEMEASLMYRRRGH